MKRLFASLVFASLIAAAANAQPQLPAPPTGAAQRPPSCSIAGTDNPFLGIQTVRLWPGSAPEAKGDGCYDVPTMTIFEPQKGLENHAAVLVFPGGAYAGLTSNNEGRQVADWFAARGFYAFVVANRLASHGYGLPVPLLDARRAIQTVRADAAKYGVDPHKIVVIGFSAGGHLAALAATQFLPGDPNATDPIDRVSSRPDFLAMGYSWLGGISTDTAGLSYCKIFNLNDQCADLAAKYTPALFVTKDTPPTFIYHQFTDNVAPVNHVLDFYSAEVKNKVPAELHIFVSGIHGTGLGSGSLLLEQWPNLLDTWLRFEGLVVQVEPAQNPRAGQRPPQGQAPPANAPVAH